MPASDDAIVFDEPTDADFEDDIPDKEKEHYKNKFKDLTSIISFRLHCTSCDKHLGCAPKSEHKMRTHPMLRTLVCQSCQAFYNSGEFEKGDDGSELYCRWCGQGGQVYCCSQCPHVFCAKCIKRNLGPSMIKEIENIDDWKCFKCDPKDLYDLRALCWAVLRYCDLKNKLAYKTENPELKMKYQKDCFIDLSTCCKDKVNKRRSNPIKKKVEEVDEEKNKNAELLSKFSPAIQVKKFALITDDRKAEKRKISPVKIKPNFMKSPAVPANCYTNPNAAKKPKLAPRITYTNANAPRIHGPLPVIRPMDKRLGAGHVIRLPPLRPMINTPTRPTMVHNIFNNGFNASIPNDNINLSLESLTQGLDFSAVAGMENSSDVVCTPDFPMEPLCEVTEDGNDDDVECITPGPIAVPKSMPTKNNNLLKKLQDPSNIIQMTENDVTVNSLTGGLKFRVDPQTLSSNKMYRLPDGRVFAINPNPNMPGGYSATIVTDGKNPTSGKTFAAKLSAINSAPLENKSKPRTTVQRKAALTKIQKPSKNKKEHRELDLEVPVEWFRYNLIDAIDSLEYSAMRLQRLKSEATTTFLRSRTVEEMSFLHKTLERLLSNSTKRFEEIRTNLNNGYKSYVSSKNVTVDQEIDEDDDDVLILPDDGEDPIYIDENSVGSATDAADDVQLLSDHNDSGEKDKDGQNDFSETTEISDDNICADINKTINDDENKRDEIKDSGIDKDGQDGNDSDKEASGTEGKEDIEENNEDKDDKKQDKDEKQHDEDEKKQEQDEIKQDKDEEKQEKENEKNEDISQENHDKADCENKVNKNDIISEQNKNSTDCDEKKSNKGDNIDQEKDKELANEIKDENILTNINGETEKMDIEEINSSKESNEDINNDRTLKDITETDDKSDMDVIASLENFQDQSILST